MKRETLGKFIGASSTGTAHSLLVEREPAGGLRFTVVGHDGVKRHAAVIVPDAVVAAIAETLSASVDK